MSEQTSHRNSAPDDDWLWYLVYSEALKGLYQDDLGFQYFEVKNIIMLYPLYFWEKYYPPSEWCFVSIRGCYPEYKTHTTVLFAWLRKSSITSLAFQTETLIFPLTFQYNLLSWDKVWTPGCLWNWFNSQMDSIHSTPFPLWSTVVPDELVRIVG